MITSGDIDGELDDLNHQGTIVSSYEEGSNISSYKNNASDQEKNYNDLLSPRTDENREDEGCGGRLLEEYQQRNKTTKSGDFQEAELSSEKRPEDN